MTTPIRRIVIKLGTNTLCNPDGMPDATLMNALAREIHELRQHGHQFLIISSGAIGAGRAALKLSETPIDVPTRQACAAVGQHRLMHAWDHALGQQKIRAAQVLVTSDTFDKRQRYTNLRNCLETLLKHGAVPILNENDTTSTDEIEASFTDNDRLGALVAARVDADLYVILSDVQGLYDKPPHTKGATIVRRVEEVTDEILAMAGEKIGKGGRGGMPSKLHSARYLTEAGVPVVIAYGRHDKILSALIEPHDTEGEEIDRPGTWFSPVGRLDGMERWLTGTRAAGSIHIDAGAAKALRDGYHLLPAGVTGADGDFPVESVVDIQHDNKIVARAISLFSRRDLERCLGLHSDEAQTALGIDGSVNITRKGRIVLLD